MLKVVVVGGGFGGLALIKKLGNQPRIKLTLVTDRHNFRYSPALYRAATGASLRIATIPIKEITKGVKNLDIIYARANQIDIAKKRLSIGSDKTIGYDVIVFSLGSVPNDFDITGIGDHAYQINSDIEIFKLRKHLHSYMEKHQRTDQNYVVVGAGPTGVETAAGLASYLRLITRRHKIRRKKINIQLLDAADRPLPSLSKATSIKTRKHLRKLGVNFKPRTLVKRETARQIITNKQPLETTTVIWTAGFKLSPFFKQNSDIFKITSKGRVYVDGNLSAYKNVYVIGDNADTPFSGYAQTAIHNANYLSKQLKRRAKNKRLSTYKPKRPISIVPVGKRWSVLEYNFIKFSGLLPASLRQIADLIGYSDIMPLRLALKIWLQRDKSHEYCQTCRKAR